MDRDEQEESNRRGKEDVEAKRKAKMHKKMMREVKEQEE